MVNPAQDPALGQGLSPVRAGAILWDIARAGQGPWQAIRARQHARLQAMVAFARQHSPYYMRLYADLPQSVPPLTALPPVTKADLMAHFDDWVTDPEVTRAQVEAFVADVNRVGELFLDRYTVWVTSGTTGQRGIFLHDVQARLVYMGLLALRCLPRQANPWDALRFLARGARVAALVASGAHYASTVSVEIARRRLLWGKDRVRLFSVLTPTAQLVSELNRFQPTVIIGYPTAVHLLAQEQRAGRLRIHPLIIFTAAEWLDPVARAEIEQIFACPLQDCYAASEFMGIGAACEEGWHHVNADWVILEPVDADRRPVPPGEPSHTVLLTNLVNRVQPLIRYDLGDSITLRPDPCPCGRPFPAVRVEGRRDDILALVDAAGRTVRILPMAIAAVVEETPGVASYQIVQTHPDAIQVRVELERDAPVEDTLALVDIRLAEFLRAHGLANVRVTVRAEAPQRDPVSGKLRQVVSQVLHPSPLHV